MQLTEHERAMLNGQTGNAGDRMALEIVVETARILGAARLVEITSSHIDGCLYHGEAGVLFVEELQARGGRVRVPTTTNVGALNLLKPDQCRLSPVERKLGYRQMLAHERMGCAPSWTCAPYQAGARPGLGQQIAWGESNAVAFANTVLGARTNRYGDYLDIACAVSARAPYGGLHCPENRHARLVFDLTALPGTLLERDAFYPVLGAIIGHEAGDAVAAVTGVPATVTEDQLKSMCAGAAATGAVALTHVIGVTPEAPDLQRATGGRPPDACIKVSPDMVRQARDRLSLAADGPIDTVALGSPHFSVDECRTLLRLAAGKPFAVPVYICTGRHTLDALDQTGEARALTDLGVEMVVDTCVVVTPILPAEPGIMMTNSAKFAHYATGNTGHLPVFGTLGDCVASAQAGHVVRDPGGWQ